MTWFQIQNAQVLAPEDLGIADVLCWGDRIVAVGTGIGPPSGVEVERVDAGGRMLLPGLIDPHIHIMGASGGDGPAYRTTDLPVSRIARAGVTTVVSPIGTDSLSRTVPALLMRAVAATAEGINAYTYIGGWRKPAPALTGDAQTDVMYLDRVLGVKIAVADPCAPPFSVDELVHLAQAAVVGGRLAGKRTVLHVHIGDRPEGLRDVWDAGKQSGLPLDRFVATHVNRQPDLMRQAIDFAKAGGSIDITCQIRKDQGYANAVDPGDAVAKALAAGAPAERVTLSSDSGAAYPRPDGDGAYMAGPDGILRTLRYVVDRGISWTQAAGLGSRHAADLLGLAGKGRIAEGADADLLLLTEDGKVDRVWSRGRLMVAGGEAVVRGYFEGVESREQRREAVRGKR